MTALLAAAEGLEGVEAIKVRRGRGARAGDQAHTHLARCSPRRVSRVCRVYLACARAAQAKYYLQKFGLTYSAEHMPVHHRLRQAYLEAIHWIMLYYYRGCQSWGWFYPFHFAPMTSDMVDLRCVACPARSLCAC